MIFYALSLFKAISRRDTPRAIVILASQLRPLVGLDASHSEVGAAEVYRWRIVCGLEIGVL
jgi:hypothetical protein